MDYFKFKDCQNLFIYLTLEMNINLYVYLFKLLSLTSGRINQVTKKRSFNQKKTHNQLNYPREIKTSLIFFIV